MYPLLSQEIARQHRESLQREVACEIPLASEIESVNWSNPWEDRGFPLPLFDRTGILCGRPVIIRQKKSVAFGRRLILSLVLLSVLMPLFGMIIGINQPILVIGSLLCLLAMVLSVVSGRI
jgi:hypothetical protein